MKIKDIQKSSNWLLFILIVTLVSGIITISGAIQSVGNFYNASIGKKKAEEKIINSLSAGLSISYFREKLGSEIMEKEVSKDFQEYTFKRYTYYVQALVDKSNSVVFWSITDCGGKDFTIKGTWLGDITLHKSRFNEVFKLDQNPQLTYFKGITANSFAYESVDLGNPSGYQAAYLGINDACSDEIFSLYSLSEQTMEPFYKEKPIYLSDVLSNSEIEQFRKDSSVNTYGETAPFRSEEVRFLFKDMKINFGADRLDLRTQRL